MVDVCLDGDLLIIEWYKYEYLTAPVIAGIVA